MSLIEKFFETFNRVYCASDTCKWYNKDYRYRLCKLCQFSNPHYITPRIILELIKILAKNSITIERSEVNGTWCAYTGMVRTNLMVYTLEDAIVEACIQLGETIKENVQELFKGDDSEK